MKNLKNWLIEDAANVTGSPGSAVMSMPSDCVKKRFYRRFKVTNEMFNKLKPGLTEWQSILSPTISEENEVLEFAKANPTCVVVFENSATGSLRAAYPSESAKP